MSFDLKKPQDETKKIDFEMNFYTLLQHFYSPKRILVTDSKAAETLIFYPDKEGQDIILLQYYYHLEVEAYYYDEASGTLGVVGHFESRKEYKT